MIGSYKQKAGLHYCCSAIRGSSIAFSSKQQHCSPRRMYSVRAMRVREYTLTGILCRNVLELMNLLDSE